jgi:sugar lactone lactonase YvrE
MERLLERSHFVSELEHIIPCRNTLGEGPIWSVDKQVVYWLDIVPDGRYYRFDPTSDHYEPVSLGAYTTAMAERVSGGFVMTTRKSFAFWDEEKKEFQPIAEPFTDQPSVRFNDAMVDCKGRFWAGTMGEGTDVPSGSLYRLDPDLSIHVMLTDIALSNGLGWNPENTIMYFTDSLKHTIYAFDFDAETGNISNQRVFAETTDGSEPDGLSVDSEGYVWSAHWNGSRIVRYAPDGAVERILDLPVKRPTSCVFGGPGLNELYITSAAVNEAERDQYPLSGDLFRLKTDIKGQAKYKFAG